MMYIYHLPHTSWFKGEKHNILANYLPYTSWFKGDKHNLYTGYIHHAFNEKKCLIRTIVWPLKMKVV